MSVTRLVVVAMMLFGFVGCGLNNDDGAQEAIKLVQEFQPSASGTPIIQNLRSTFSNDQWQATKTTDGMYRVTFRGSKSGQMKELVFSVSLHSKQVIALNRDALAFTNPT